MQKGLAASVIGFGSVFAGCDGQGLLFPLDNMNANGYLSKCVYDDGDLDLVPPLNGVEVSDSGKCLYDEEDLGLFYSVKENKVDNSGKISNDSSSYNIINDTHSSSDYNSNRYTITEAIPFVRPDRRMIGIRQPPVPGHRGSEFQIQYGRGPIPGSGNRPVRHFNIRTYDNGVRTSNYHIPVGTAFVATNVVAGHYSQIGLMNYHTQQYGYYRNLIEQQRQNWLGIYPNYYPQMNFHLNQFNRYYNQTRFTP